MPSNVEPICFSRCVQSKDVVFVITDVSKRIVIKLLPSHLVTILVCIFFYTELAIFGGKQVASARHDGDVLWQWLCIPLHRRQTSDPEEVKWSRAVFQPSR